MKAATGVNGVWKWIATSMALIFVAFFTPSYGWFIDSRDQVSNEQFNIIQDRQQIILQLLAVLETQFKINQEILTNLEEKVDQHSSEGR